VYYQGYKLDEPVNGNPIPSRDKRFFSPPKYPDHLWHSTSLQCYGYHKVIPQGYSRWGMKLTTHFCLVPPTSSYAFMACSYNFTLQLLNEIYLITFNKPYVQALTLLLPRN